MKRLLFILFTIHCTLFTLNAQTIRSGSKWWDGSVLYTAKVDASGEVTMNGVDAHEGGFRFMLAKDPTKQGRYTLTTDNPDAYMPVRGLLGWRVDYVRQEGMNFLAVRNPQGDAVWILVLTPDDLKDCIGQERSAEQKPVSNMLQTWLMNTTYLGRFSKAELRLMRNEILARHGWKFQSKDLQEYFGKQSWYKPGKDNNAIKLSIIEQTNVQLIKSEEAVPDEDRAYTDYSSGPTYNEDLRELVDGGDSDDVDEVGGTYTVRTEKEFLAALGNGRTVIIAKDTHLNLSRVLENEALFANVKGRRWSSDASASIGTQPLVISESETDGRQLALVNFKELTIKGEKNTSIEVDPRYSFCLYFINCEHCEVHNLTIGHTEGGFCSGGVIGMRGGRMNVIKDCDLYGCGTYGIDARETNDLGVINTSIHDCTYGILQFNGCTAVKFTKCDFFNNREYGLVESWGSQGVVFDDCRFFANWGDSKLFYFDTTFYLMGCEIYHPTENLGTMNMADQSGKKNWFSPNPLDKNIKTRHIGPKDN